MRIHIPFIIAAALLIACTDNNDDSNGNSGHVWQSQTDTLQKSKDMANELQKNLNLQQQQIEQADH